MAVQWHNIHSIRIVRCKNFSRKEQINSHRQNTKKAKCRLPMERPRNPKSIENAAQTTRKGNGNNRELLTRSYSKRCRSIRRLCYRYGSWPRYGTVCKLGACTVYTEHRCCKIYQTVHRIWCIYVLGTIVHPTPSEVPSFEDIADQPSVFCKTNIFSSSYHPLHIPFALPCIQLILSIKSANTKSRVTGKQRYQLLAFSVNDARTKHVSRRVRTFSIVPISKRFISSPRLLEN